MTAAILIPRQGQGVAPGCLPLSAIVPWAGLPGKDTSATTGRVFVYLLCPYLEPISGAGTGCKPVLFQH